MLAIIDHYAQNDSWLHRWHPVVKLAGLLAAIVVAVSLQGVVVLLVALAGAWGLALASTVPAGVILRRQKVALLLGAAVAVVGWIAGIGDVHWRLKWLSIPVEPFVAGLVLTLKISCVLVLTVPLLATQPFYVLLDALRRVHLPDRVVTMLLLMSRYNLVLADRMQSTLRAAKLRGLQLSARPARLRPLGSILGAMVLRSLAQAERVEQAMRLRGFDGRIRVSWPYELQRADWLKLTAVAAAAVILLVWDLSL